MTSAMSCAEWQTWQSLSDSLIQVVQFIINIKSLFLTFLFLEEEMALAAQDACIAISGLVEQLNTHTGIFSRLRNAVEAGDINHESEVDRHVARLFLQDFLQCGIHLPDDDREKVVFLNDQILRLGMIFVFLSFGNCLLLLQANNLRADVISPE